MNTFYTLYDFIALSHEQKIHLLKVDGVFLEVTRITPPFEVKLYSLYDFYVEEYFYQGSNEIVNINAFISNRRLERYLPGIDISEAINHL
ncbi:MAG TPA: hypothetical protein VD794_02485 [Flavisolibacter sp.]|nr:hypothetical protein [Flavisolibacter sp.]